MICSSGKCQENKNDAWFVHILEFIYGNFSYLEIFIVLERNIPSPFHAQLLMFDFSVRIYSLFITFFIKIIIHRLIIIIIIIHFA